MTILINATSADGRRAWFTGRAGSGFVHEHISQAFDAGSLENGRRIALRLNRMTEIHGWRFVCPSIQINQE